MTQCIKLKNSDGWYILKEDFGDVPLYTLRFFLTDDLPWNAERFKNLRDQYLVEFCGNISSVTKKGESLIIELDVFNNDQNDVYYIFSTTYENFIKIITDWENTIKQKPDYITIYRDDDKVWFSTEE